MNDTNYLEPLSDNDFTELLLRHMILSPEVFQKAKQLKITGDDLVLDNTYGDVLYREIVTIINSVDNSPLTADAIFNGLHRRFEDGLLENGLKEHALNLITYFFDPNRPLERPEFFDGKLIPFIKKRRANKLIALYRDDLPVLTRELNKLNFDLNSDSIYSRPRILNPFANIILKTKNTLIGTCLSRIDAKIQGLMTGEYAMLIGYSGGGKTAIGSHIIGASAEMGRKAMYVSCEEHEEDLSQRLYSRVFRIPYAQLRQGSANIQLQSYFNTELTAEKQKRLADNLCLVGLKGVGEITSEYLYETWLHHFEETGFIPEIIMVDQLQFITPSVNVRRAIQSWEVEKVVAAELDELSHRQIGSKNFVLWVQHQAKGKLKAMFTRDEIDGFKGIIHKTDLVLGVGRESNKSDQVNIFSLKTRHCQDFSITLKTEFEYMTVTSTEVSDSLSGQTETTVNPTMTAVNNTPIRPTS